MHSKIKLSRTMGSLADVSLRNNDTNAGCTWEGYRCGTTSFFIIWSGAKGKVKLQDSCGLMKINAITNRSKNIDALNTVCFSSDINHGNGDI